MSAGDELRLRLGANEQQYARLLALQTGFAELCNAIAPAVQQSRIWNRVVLHHMVYRSMRERFPAMGSQMVCNAVYSVSRAARLVFQTPGSPFHHSRLVDKPLPMIRFTDQCPVFFDRHTLSVKSGQMSMFTLDGRMKFELSLQPDQQAAFVSRRIQEMMLLRIGDQFELRIQFEALRGQQSASLPTADVGCESLPLPKAGGGPTPRTSKAARPRAVSVPLAPPISLQEFLLLESAPG